MGNHVFMLENAVYSVISPESCAAIIYRDSSKAEQAAAALRLTAEDLLGFGLIDGIIPEPAGRRARRPRWGRGGARRTNSAASFDELSKLGPDEIVQQRYTKFRRMGNFFAP